MDMRKLPDNKKLIYRSDKGIIMHTDIARIRK
jgi:hypothetical protein